MLAEIRLELALNRPSGALAGIVAALAQFGLSLKRQKVERTDRARGGRLFIRAEGEPPDPVVLSERLDDTPGVDRVVRIEIDGEALWADGQRVDHPAADRAVDPVADAAAGPAVDIDADAFAGPTAGPTGPPAETGSETIADPVTGDDFAALLAASSSRESASYAELEPGDEVDSEDVGTRRPPGPEETDPWLDPLASEDPEIDAWLSPDGRTVEPESRPAPLNADDMPLLLEMEAGDEPSTSSVQEADDNRPGSDVAAEDSAVGGVDDEAQRRDHDALEPGGRSESAPLPAAPTPESEPEAGEETAASGMDDALETAVGEPPRRRHSTLRRRRQKRR